MKLRPSPALSARTRALRLSLPLAAAALIALSISTAAWPTWLAGQSLVHSIAGEVELDFLERQVIVDDDAPQASILWSSSGGSAWLTGSNWTGGIVPTNADIAQFGANPTSSNGAGINFANATNAGTQVNGQRIQEVGAVEITSARTVDMTIGNSSSTSGATGTFRPLGVTVNGNANVIIRNDSTRILTIKDTQASGNQTMGLELGNSTENVVSIDGTGAVDIASIISGSNRNLTKSGTGAGFLLISAINTYTGATKISTGTLKISAGGSIASSSSIEVAGGATFDVTGPTTGFTMGSAQTLKATGASLTGTIAVVSGRNLTTGVSSPIEFTSFSGSTAPLTVSGASAGQLILQTTNPVTVTVSNGGTPLTPGDYKLIAKSGAASVTGLPTTLTVNGDGVVGTPSLVLISGELFLRVTANPPTATTNAATSVTGTTATLNGTGNPGGAATTGWFRYSTTSPGTCNDSFGTRAPTSGGSALGSGTSNVAFNEAITGLTPGSTYFFCAITQNSEGTAFGSLQQFTTPLPPSATTSAASAITTTSAQLNGSANPNLSSATGWFRLFTSDPGACADSGGTRVPSTGGTALGSGNSSVAYNQSATGLSPATTYWFCAIAQSAEGTGFGSVLQFTTLPNPPFANTTGASALTSTTATLNGTGNPNGGAATGWFRYTAGDPGSCNDTFGTRVPSTGGTALGSGTSGVPYSEAITGLSPLTVYYYCAIVSNAGGTTFGTLMTFIPPLAPSVTTDAATSVATTTATLNGTANPNRATTTGWFRYSTTDPGTCNDTFGTRAPTTGGSGLGSGGSGQAFSQGLTGLSPSTTYYFCAIASNSEGTGFGSVLQFTTAAAPNSAPVINNPGTIKVGTNATLDTTVFADDADNNDTLTFSIAASQTCVGTEYTGTIFFTGPVNSITTTPTRSSQTLRVQTTPSTTPGSYVKRLRVSDVAGAEGFFCAQITVNFANTPPVWVTTTAKVTEPSGTDAVPVQRGVSLTVDDVDINQNVLFSLAGGTGNCGASPTHPFTGFGFSPNPVATTAGNESTLMTFNVGANDAPGPYCIRVNVTDRDSGNNPLSTVSQDITVNVNAANSTPVVNDPGTINVNINSTVDTTVFTDDADNNETLTFSIAASQTCVGTEYTGTILFTGPTNSITTTPTRSSKTLRIQTTLGTAPGNYVKRIQVSDGTAQGFFCVQITVPASAPTVTTNAATSVTTTGATLNGEANPHGNATTGWFRYSTTSPGTCNDTFGTRAPTTGGTSLGSGTSSAPFSQGIASLSPNTTYYFCAIAQNSIGTGLGAVLQFTTQGQPPSITTDSANSITATSANLRGAGNPNGTATTGWFRYSTTNPGACNDTFGIRVPSTGGTALGSGTSFVLFNESVGSLAPNTTYYYCAIGGSAQGTGLGALTVFTTLVGPPETQLTGAPPDPTNDNTPTFTFTGSTSAPRTIAGFQCSINAAPFTACSSPHTTPPLADGNYNFQVRAVDDQGTPDPTPEVTFFTIDTVPPTINYGAVQTNSTANVTFTANVADNLAVAEVRVFFSLNGGPFNSAVCAAMLGEGGPTPYQCTIPGQPSGTAVAYYVRATDTAGNNGFEPPAAAPNMYLTGTGGVVPGGTYSTLFLSVGATPGGDLTVEDALILAASSIVDTGGNTLTLGCNATVTGAGPNSYVVGPVEKQFCGIEVFTFPVGTAVGARPDSPEGTSEYSPLTASVRAVGALDGDPPAGFANSLTVSVVDDWLPGVVQASGVSRYWSVTETGSVRADLAMTYLDQDINGPEANYKPFRRSGGTTVAFASFTNDPGTNTTTALDVTTFSDWGIGALVPTAADVSISGRAIDANGGYIRGVRITVTGGTLTAPRTALTNAFGYYSIGGLTAGETYIITAGSKRFTFRTPSRVVSPGSDLIDVDFVAEPGDVKVRNEK
jgi:hypothetical protein